MSEEIEVHADIPVDVLIRKLLNNGEFTSALAEIIRTNILTNARAYGTALGGYAGTSSTSTQTSAVNQGHWDAFGYWVKN